MCSHRSTFVGHPISGGYWGPAITKRRSGSAAAPVTSSRDSAGWRSAPYGPRDPTSPPPPEGGAGGKYGWGSTAQYSARARGEPYSRSRRASVGPPVNDR